MKSGAHIKSGLTSRMLIVSGVNPDSDCVNRAQPLHEGAKMPLFAEFDESLNGVLDGVLELRDAAAPAVGRLPSREPHSLHTPPH